MTDETATDIPAEDKPDNAGQQTDTPEQPQETPQETQEAGQAGQEPDKPQADWRAAIEDADLRKFTDQFATPADLAKMALNARKTLSSGITGIPGADASEEEVAAFKEKIGAPKDADGYDLTVPESYRMEDGTEVKVDMIDQERIDRFKPIMAAHHIPQAAAKDLLNEVVRARVEDEIADQKALTDLVSAQVEKDRAAEGADYDRNTEFAARAVDALGDDDFKNFLDGATVEGLPLGEHPEFRKVFSKIGRRMGEDTVLIEHDQNRQAELTAKRDDLTRKIADAADAGDHALARKLDQERAKITAQLVNDGPIVGSMGRAA